ncbi:hypothetical protein [Lactobacillus sp. ESL0228]|uniref:hypothetical protein n=1 Tax=Lactobacillus sp. ESL0228 TaxID=2069352 RepID=UPI000EFD3251|nr:hypothetical protein [Lactobacillus sp. ESL0228]RMC49604.1 hypothetical protein F5ESL0228_02435 [Lactobacillus sp. ESL0228]
MNDERKKEIKDKVTQLLGDKANNDLIDFSLDRVIQSVANFTNIPVDELPPEIDSTIIAMCLQLIQTHEWTRKDVVNSISEGDVSVNFGSPAELYAQVQKINPVTDDFISDLIHFRRLPQ